MFPYQKQLKSSWQVFKKILPKTFKKLTIIFPDRLGTPSGHGGTYKTQIFGNYMFVKMATGFPAISIQPWPTLVETPPYLGGGLLSFHFLYKMCIKKIFPVSPDPLSRGVIKRRLVLVGVT